ncbi:MAG: prolyl oligopeptidase family serine peptidase [Herpetosiphon sp.]
MRHRWLTLLLIVASVVGTTPAAAKIAVIDPSEPPKLTLSQPEAEKLALLQSAALPIIRGDVSPDDQVFVGSIGRDTRIQQYSFININDGSIQPIRLDLAKTPPRSHIVWRDNDTAVFLSAERDVGSVLVLLDRNTGSVRTEKIRLPGFPLSIAPNASRILVAIASAPEAKSLDQSVDSPFTLKITRSPFDTRLQWPEWDTDRRELQVAPGSVTIASYDLNSREFIPLEDLLPGSAVVSAPSWSSDGSKVTFVHMTFPRIDRQGNILSEVETQDGLGNLPPEENPFFQTNAVDTFDIAQKDFHPEFLKAIAGNGDLFADAQWATDGQSLVTAMAHPSKARGRRFPSYSFNDRTYYRFYGLNGALQRVLDRPELEAPSSGTVTYASPDEILINVAFGTSFHIYYFNRRSGEFHAVTQNAGIIYQHMTTHLSRRVIFNTSSFGQPPELFRMQWEGTALYELTFANNDVKAASKVRADQISFTLKSGAQRTGYLVQPAGAPFPPRNTNLIVWQEGGPDAPVVNQWGGSVEAPFNLLANFGFAVLIVPLEGREGFGPQQFLDLVNDRNFGQIDIDEQVEIVEQMIKSGATSQGHVGITGCSYGGYFAAQSITRHPTLYAAANPQCALLDLFNEWQFGYTPVVSFLEGRTPTTDPGEYVKDSPLYNAHKVRTPTLMFAGSQDFLPAQISANFHDQIEAQKIPAAFLLFQNEGHGLRARSSQFTAGQAQIAWFRKFLTDAPRH